MSSTIGIGLMAHGGAGWLGGSYYVENLCRALLLLPTQERKAVRITMVGNDRQLAQMGQLSERVDATIVVDRQPAIGLWQRQRFRWRRLARGNKTPWTDDMISDAGIDFLYPYCPQDDTRRRFQSAAWQPDFQHCEMPVMFKPEEIEERNNDFRRAQRFADRIVLSSENARAHCRIHFPEALPKLSVLPFASVLDPATLSGDPLEAIAQFHLPGKFFILSNQFWRHKNHDVVWDALAVLQQRGVRPNLVCTGHTYDYRHPGHFDQLLEKLHRSDLAGQVRILGVIPRRLQLLLMRQSVAVIQPSLFEGWSTAVEDARALGCPTVLSDTEIHREQDPRWSQYFEAENPLALADVLQELWESAAAGRDPEREREAGARQVERVRSFAAGFLVIARGQPNA